MILASPAFYFSWHLIHRESIVNCVLRSVTGTLRIVPFMGMFYGSFALLLPFVTGALMQHRGQTFEEAKGNSMMGSLLCGFVFMEALIELRGCGVAYSQLRPMHFIIFMPALVGRLAAGVLTQYNKIGEEFVSVVPEEWAAAEAPAWQRALARVAKTACIDAQFFTTLVGTSVFQHVLNAVTFIALTKGKAGGAREIGSYLAKGLGGTYLSGLLQLLNTVGMRFAFVGVWNWCSSQPLIYPAMDAAIQEMQAAELGTGAGKGGSGGVDAA